MQSLKMQLMLMKVESLYYFVGIKIAIYFLAYHLFHYTHHLSQRNLNSNNVSTYVLYLNLINFQYYNVDICVVYNLMYVM